MTGLEAPGQVIQLSLVDYNGRERYRNESHVHADNAHLYYVGPFVPPKDLVRANVSLQYDTELRCRRRPPKD